MMGNHPTTWPPPMPSPFHIPTGKFAHRTTKGYALAVPWDDSLILSAYKMKQNGAALRPGGRQD
jgi:hypothetical protein